MGEMNNRMRLREGWKEESIERWNFCSLETVSDVGHAKTVFEETLRRHKTYVRTVTIFWNEGRNGFWIEDVMFQLSKPL